MAEEHVTDLERDLAALLAVEPSAAFPATVRARIEADRRGAGAGWRWAYAAAAVIVVAAGLLLLREPAIREVREVAVARPSSTDVRLPVERPARVKAEAPSRPVSTAPARRQQSPVILIDARQADAVRRLLATAARARRAPALELPVDSPPPAIPAISVDPMLVEPLPVPDITSPNKGVIQ